MRPGLTPRGQGGSDDCAFWLQPGVPHSQYFGVPLIVLFVQLHSVPQQCRLQLQSGRGHILGPGRMFLTPASKFTIVHLLCALVDYVYRKTVITSAHSHVKDRELVSKVLRVLGLNGAACWALQTKQYISDS